MSTEKHIRQKNNKIDSEQSFFNLKLTFSSGIVVLVTLVFAIINLFIDIKSWIECILVVVTVLCVGLIISNGKLDLCILRRRKNCDKFGNCFTLFSILYFALDVIFENFLNNKEDLVKIELVGCSIESKYIVCVIYSLFIAGGLYLLFSKGNKSSQDRKHGDLRKITEQYRKAIENARDTGKLTGIMKYFPHGCSKEASRLFGKYLSSIDVHVKEVTAFYDANEAEKSYNHTWLVDDYGRIIDLTADQFFVEKETNYYKSLKKQRCLDDFSLLGYTDLQKDYKEIKKRIK